VNDAENFRLLCQAMAAIGITATELDVIFRVLSAILALGNIEFKENEAEEGQIASITETYTVTHAAELLGVARESLEHLLLNRTINEDSNSSISETKESRVVLQRTFYQANSARDSVAKTLYQV
jgi:myosin heavy subunit